MSLSRAIKFCSVLAASVLAAGVASAAPPHGGGGGAHPGGAHVGAPGGARPPAAHPPGAPHVAYGGAYRPVYYPTPYYSGYRGVGVGVGIGYGYGSGIGNLGYGYGGYGYSGGYNSLGYGGYSLLGVPAIPGTYSAPPYSVVPVEPLATQPQPLPLPPATGSGEAAPATITVVASEGTKVSFDGIDTDQTGTRHSFTTKAIEPGVEKRVSVRVDGPGGPATLTIRVRAGEKATIDMRK